MQLDPNTVTAATYNTQTFSCSICYLETSVKPCFTVSLLTSAERGQVNKEEEQEEDSHTDNEDCYMRAHPICSASALSQQELLNKIKPAYN